MKKIAEVAKFVVALVGTVATIISTSAVPEKWKALAATIASAVTALSVYLVPNASAK